jgi:hypothetical protein
MLILSAPPAHQKAPRSVSPETPIAVANKAFLLRLLNPISLGTAVESEVLFIFICDHESLGKTMQNVRTQMDLHVTTDPKNAMKWFSKCNFKNNAYANGLYLIETQREKLVYDKPVYVGCAILDLSNLNMLEFHYDVID